MDNQDWTPVFINSKAKVDATKKEVASRPPGKTNQQKNLESDEPKIRYVDRDISQLIINGRLAKKLNRKQLAIGMMIPESVIADWETGKAIYNGPLLDKFKRYLGVSH